MLQSICKFYFSVANDFPVLALDGDDLVVAVEGYSGHDHGLEVRNRRMVVGMAVVVVRRPAEGTIQMLCSH